MNLILFSFSAFIFTPLVQSVEHAAVNRGVVSTEKIKYSSIAQSVEHAAVNRRVVGSSPTWGAREYR